MIFNVYRPPWAIIAFEGEDEGAGPKGDDKDKDKEIEEWRTENTKLVEQLQALVTRLDAVEGRPAHDPAAAKTEADALKAEIAELKADLKALKETKPKAPPKQKSPPPKNQPPKSGEDDRQDREPAPDRKPRRTLARL